MIVGLLLSALASAQAASTNCNLEAHGFKDKEKFTEFVQDLKAYARYKDQEKLSELIHYPLQVKRSKGKDVVVKDKAEFKKQFSTIFTDKVLNAVNSQTADEIFCNAQGAKFGAGEIWIKQFADKIGVATINL